MNQHPLSPLQTTVTPFLPLPASQPVVAGAPWWWEGVVKTNDDDFLFGLMRSGLIGADLNTQHDGKHLLDLVFHKVNDARLMRQRRLDCGTSLIDQIKIDAGSRPRSGVFNVAVALIAHGANPWPDDWNQGNRVSSVALNRRDHEALDLVLSHPNRPPQNELDQWTEIARCGGQQSYGASNLMPKRIPALHLAAALGDSASVDTLLRQGFDVNQRDARGRTAAFYAGDGETLRVLLEGGSRVDAVDDDGETMGVFWSEFLATAKTKAEYQGHLIERMKRTMSADEIRTAQTPDVFKAVISGTKTEFLTLFRKCRLDSKTILDFGAGGRRNLLTQAILRSTPDSDERGRMFVSWCNEQGVDWGLQVFDDLPGSSNAAIALLGDQNDSGGGGLADLGLGAKGAKDDAVAVAAALLVKLITVGPEKGIERHLSTLFGLGILDGVQLMPADSEKHTPNPSTTLRVPRAWRGTKWGRRDDDIQVSAGGLSRLLPALAGRTDPERTFAVILDSLSALMRVSEKNPTRGDLIMKSLLNNAHQGNGGCLHVTAGLLRSRLIASDSGSDAALGLLAALCAVQVKDENSWNNDRVFGADDTGAQARLAITKLVASPWANAASAEAALTIIEAALPCGLKAGEASANAAATVCQSVVLRAASNVVSAPAVRVGAARRM